MFGGDRELKNFPAHREVGSVRHFYREQVVHEWREGREGRERRGRKRKREGKDD